MFKTIFVLSFILTSSVLNAQTFYKKYGNVGVNEGALCTVKSPDGNIFIGGYKDDSALVLKVGPTGIVIWAKCFKPVSSACLVHDLAISPDGFLTGVGNSINTSTNVPRDAFCFKMDIAGTLLWVNNLNDTRDIFFDHIIPISATSYTIFGSIYDQSSITFPDIFSVNVDALTGVAITTSPRYDYVPANSFIDDCYSSTQNSSNTAIYTTGRIYINGASMTSMRPFLSRYSITGQHQWSKYLLFNSSQNARLYGIDIVFDNNSITIAYFGDNSGASSNFSVGLIHLDTLGNVIWSKDYNLTATLSEVSTNLIATPTGYLLAGYQLTGGNDLFLLSTDFQGNVNWVNSYGSSTSVENLKYTHLNNTIVDGNFIYYCAQSTQTGNTDIILMKTDLTGTVQCISPNNLNYTTTLNPLNSISISISAINDPLTYSSPTVITTPQPLPDDCSSLNVNLGPDTNLCNGSITLNSTVAGATQYLWSNGFTNPTLQITQQGTYWVQVTVNCCILTDTIVIGSANPPTASLNYNISPCSGLIQFENNSTNSTSWIWQFGDNNTSNLQAPSHVYSSVGNYTVSLISSNSCGSDTFSIVIVVQSIGVNAEFESNLISSINSMSIYQFTDNSTGNITSWQWYFNDTISSNLPSPLFTYSQSGSYPVILIVTDASGCTDSTSLTIVVETEFSFYIPNTFTPNGDGINDEFNGVGNGINEYEILIFNRWGELIFESGSISNNWDGTYHSNPVQQDVYVYKIKLSTQAGREYNYYGHINLIR